MKKKDYIPKSSASIQPSRSSFIETILNRSTIGKEISAGFTTAFMSLFLILGGASIVSNLITQNQSLFYAMAALSLIVSAVFTVIASFYVRIPVVFTLSIGINTLLASAVVQKLSLDWTIALGLIFLESILFSLLVLTPLPKKFISSMPSFFKYAWPLCLGGIIIFVGLLSGRAISFFGSSGISVLSSSNPELFLFLIGALGAFLLYKSKDFSFYAAIPLLMALLAMIIPTTPGLDMNKALVIVGSFTVGWLLLYSILVDAKKKYALNLSLGLLIVGLIASVVFSDKAPGAIITPPFLWLGRNGVFQLPSFAPIFDFIGYPLISIGGVFSQINQLWSVLASILVVHFFSTWSLIATLQPLMNHSYDNSSSTHSAEKRIFALEGASSMLASHFSFGSGTITVGSIFSYFSGGKTVLSSITTGLVLVLSAFMLPFMHRFINMFTISPLLLVLGFWLIIQTFQHFHSFKEDLTAVMAVFITGVMTWNLYIAFVVGLLVFVIDRLTKRRGSEINIWVWSALLVLLLFAIILKPASFLQFINY